MNKAKQKMSAANRAKQFMPFSPLQGLMAALEKKERMFEAEPERELSEDAAEELNRKLTALRPGQTVTVTHYSSGRYLKTTGVFKGLQLEQGTLALGETAVPLCHVLDCMCKSTSPG